MRKMVVMMAVLLVFAVPALAKGPVISGTDKPPKLNAETEDSGFYAGVESAVNPLFEPLQWIVDLFMRENNPVITQRPK